MSLKYLIVLVALVASACAGDSPTGPSATPAPPVVQAPPPPPAPLWTLTGTGAMVFDVPVSVKRVHVTGDLTTGRSENFILWVGRDLLVNEILGTCSISCVGNHFEGTYLTKGGTGASEHCTGITWTMTEVR